MKRLIERKQESAAVKENFGVLDPQFIDGPTDGIRSALHKLAFT
jgi:hypothetical protein